MSEVMIRNVCALGTGAMGASTALDYAMGGCNVTLYGRSQTSLDKGMASIRGSLQSLIGHGLITRDRADAVYASIRTTTELREAAKNADLVIESIAEDLAVKQDVFKQLDAMCPPHTIFSTNTSALSPTAIAEAISRKDKFVVTHFFNPAHLLPVVEIVPGSQTSKETVEAAYSLLTSIGKMPVRLIKEAPGFIVNAVQASILNAALLLLEEGVATAADIDAVARGSIGKRLAVMGPLELIGRADSIPAEGKPAQLDKAVADTIVNRLQGAMFDTASQIFESGIAENGDVDTAIRGTLGRRLEVTGPLESADLGGLDIFSSIFQTVGLPVPSPMAKPVAAGNFGAKTGTGVYTWDAERLPVIRAKREARLVDHLRQDRAKATVAVSAMTSAAQGQLKPVF